MGVCVKLQDKVIFDDAEDKIIHKRTFDVEPSIKQAKAIRDQGFDTNHAKGVSESYLVARMPTWLISKIIKDAGLTWDDPAAQNAVMRALQSGQYDKFRVWGGNLGRENAEKIVVGPSIKAKVAQHWSS